MTEPLWKPSAERVAAANMTAFMRFVGERYPGAPRDYPSLYRWSLDQSELFWPAVWDFRGVVGDPRSDTVVVDYHDMLAARWFPEARLNYAENLLKHRDERPAIIYWNEHGFQR